MEPEHLPGESARECEFPGVAVEPLDADPEQGSGFFWG